MKTMSLKEVRIAKQRLWDELESLQEKRKRIATVKVLPGENARDFIDVTADALTREIDICIENLVAAGNAVRCGEMGVKGEPGGEDVASCRERVALLRKEAELCKEMGAQTPKAREAESLGGSGTQLVSVVTYDIKTYDVRAERLRGEIDSLSMRIAQMELGTMVEMQS
ncbi:MAG: hypothetical protein IJ741_06165 [Schwartzia sp.]|nr:hypothetical protein [Schwartzia sp. (in: firmicutes)]